jgi:predicted nucleic acid-binding protein
VTILDSYAVIAFLRGEAAAPLVQPLLEAGDAGLTAVGVAEVVDHLVRLARVEEDEVALDLAQLGLLDGLPVSAGLGQDAGRLRARHYHRTRCPVSMADCIAAVTARATGRPLATADPRLLDVSTAEGIDVIALPASDRTTWTPRPA